MSQHPSSGILKTVTAASGTGHTTCTTTPLQRGLFLGRTAKDKDIVNVSKTEIQVFEDLVHETLESLGSVT